MAEPSPLRTLLYAVADTALGLLAAIPLVLPVAVPVAYWWLRA